MNLTSNMSSDLDDAKQRLMEKLGPNYDVYAHLLGKWFRGLISKKEFDENAKQLIKQNFVAEHNKFWLAFFHHCANNSSIQTQPSGMRLDGNPSNQTYQNAHIDAIDCDSSRSQCNSIPNCISNIKCLPNRVMTNMKIYVIAWEMGLNSVNDHVSSFVNLALQQFLKNIITEAICSKTAYRLRENKFKHAIGVKPMNPYLMNSLKIYTSTLEYDPYQIESNKMNCSLVDSYAYNDSLFPSRLYEAQALHEFACSTTSIVDRPRTTKKMKLSDILRDKEVELQDDDVLMQNGTTDHGDELIKMNGTCDLKASQISSDKSCDLAEHEDNSIEIVAPKLCANRKLTMEHLLLAFLSNKSIIPSHSLYSINFERILSKLTI